VRISGSVTISISGAPDRLKSTRVARRPSAPTTSPWTSLAVSSSRCARVMFTTNGPSDVSIDSRPRAARGIAYWLIWYPFGRSG
jgi:hypothetical protein